MRNFVDQSPGKIFKDFIGWCAPIKGRFRFGEFNFPEMSQMLPKREECCLIAARRTLLFKSERSSLDQSLSFICSYIPFS